MRALLRALTYRNPLPHLRPRRHRARRGGWLYRGHGTRETGRYAHLPTDPDAMARQFSGQREPV